MMPTHRANLKIILFLMGTAALVSSCALGPDPSSPKTYRLELSRYTRDTGALPGSWKKFLVEGLERDSFFFAHDSREAVITVAFTCGKYRDIAMPILAEHLVIPMGRNREVIHEGYVRRGWREIYHLVARGPYLFQKEETYLDLGHVEDERAEMMLDAYLVREPHCLVDLSLAATPSFYERALPDFEALLESMGTPVERAGEGE